MDKLEPLHAIHREAVKLVLSSFEDDEHDSSSSLNERLGVLRVAARGVKTPTTPTTRRSFIPYPSIENPLFEETLGRKFEFAEHAAHAAHSPNEQSAACGAASRFDLTRVQILVRNFMAPGTPYNGLLLFHGVGVGKTCAAVTIAEMYAGKIKNGIKVVTRRALLDSFKKALFDPARPYQCTGNTYTDMVVDRDLLSLEQIESRVTRKINERYSFLTPITFANNVSALGADTSGVPLSKAVWNKRIRDQWSHSVIIVDEAHSLRGSDAKQMASALMRVLKVTSNVKLVLLTATPMFNHSSDIISLVNMLRINDKRTPIALPSLATAAGVPDAADAAKLAAAIRGYVSHMPGNDPFRFPMRVAPADIGDPLSLRAGALSTVAMNGTRIAPDDRLGADMCRFIVASRYLPGGVHQLECDLLQSRVGDIGDNVDDTIDDILRDEDEDMSKGFTTLTNLMQAQNVVFPSGKYGKTGFLSAFMTVGNDQAVSYRAGVPHLLAPAHISQYAPKMAAVVDRVLKCEGVAIVYSRYIYSGILSVAIALEHAGFRRYMASPILRDGKVADAHAHAHAHAHAPTYAIISSSNFASALSATLDTLAGAANIAGERIKVVLISEKGSEGITIKYAREVHVLEPWYHLNKIEQVVGRGSRFCSHAGLPPERQNLTVYLHAMAKDNKETLDMRMYRMAARKQRGIDVVETILKQHAFDCNVHTAHHASIKRTIDRNSVTVRASNGRVLRNQMRTSSVPTCLPKTLPPAAADIDYSTYSNKVHTHGERMYVDAIVEYYIGGGRVSATYIQLWKHVRESIPDSLQTRMNVVLNRMLKQRVVMNTDVRPGFLVHRGTRYMFQPIDDNTTYLTDVERSMAGAQATTARRVSLSTLPDVEFRAVSKKGREAEAEAEPQTEAQTAAAALKLGTHTVMRLESAAALRRQRAQLPIGYADAAMDAEIDRLGHTDVTIIGTLFIQNAAFRQKWKRVRASMEASGVLDVKANRVRNPYNQNHKQHGRQAAGQDVLATIFAKAGTVVFKVVEEHTHKAHTPPARGAARTGSVCHQTTMSIQKLKKLVISNIISDIDIAAVLESLGKRDTCNVYELLLRKHAPQSIVRHFQRVE